VGPELSRAARSAAGLRSVVCFRALGQIVHRRLPNGFEASSCTSTCSCARASC